MPTKDASLIPAEINFRITPCCYGCQQYDDDSYGCRRFDCHAPPNGLCELFDDADPPRHGGAVKPVRAAPHPAPKKSTCQIGIAAQPENVDLPSVFEFKAFVPSVLGSKAFADAVLAEEPRWKVTGREVRLITRGGYLAWPTTQILAELRAKEPALPHAAAHRFGGPEALGALAQACLRDEGGR